MYFVLLTNDLTKNNPVNQQKKTKRVLNTNPVR